MAVAFTLNGKPASLDVEPEMPLLWALREAAGLTGTKFGCGLAQCGACTVHLDGAPVRSCQTTTGDVAGRAVVTIEAVGGTPIGKAVQEAWIAHQVPQCGYCQSGQIMSAAVLLATNRAPTDADIDAAMRGNICRCGTYNAIRAAIKTAAKSLG
ncbi:MAG: (2Fe-2S)-binding protein [Rhodospirillales bacterium]|nr:MAG: (2Fe-2S)-binding protein [Rhodospirillales bacterium]